MKLVLFFFIVFDFANEGFELVPELETNEDGEEEEEGEECGNGNYDVLLVFLLVDD